MNNYYYDTVVITNTYHDTTVVNNYIYDTIYLNRYIFDTIYIHDTVYVTQEGIDEIAVTAAKIYQRNGMIVVEGAEGQDVRVFDAVGRTINNGKRKEESGPTSSFSLPTFEVPSSGVYLVKIGDAPARRVVVIR